MLYGIETFGQALQVIMTLPYVSDSFRSNSSAFCVLKSAKLVSA